MEEFRVLEENIDEKVKDLNLVYDENKDLRGAFEDLIARYCFQPKGVEEFNKILGTSHEDCFWKMKLIEVTNRKKGIEPAPKEKHTMEELINDVDVPGSKKLFNTPSENLMRGEAYAHYKYLYLDIIQGLYYTLASDDAEFAEKFEAEEKYSPVLTETVYDFIDDILYMDRLTADNLKNELADGIKSVTEKVRECQALYERDFFLYIAGVLMWHSHSIKIEERENYVEEAIERIAQGEDVANELLSTLQETYVIFAEMLYAVLYKKTEGDHAKMVEILKAEIQTSKEELQITEENGFDKLHESVYRKAPRTEENDLYKAVKAVVTGETVPVEEAETAEEAVEEAVEEKEEVIETVEEATEEKTEESEK